jgi:hypothetical protein
VATDGAGTPTETTVSESTPIIQGGKTETLTQAVEEPDTVFTATSQLSPGAL